MTVEDHDRGDLVVTKPPPNFQGSRIPRSKYSRSDTQSIKSRWCAEPDVLMSSSKLQRPKSYIHATSSLAAAENKLLESKKLHLETESEPVFPVLSSVASTAEYLHATSSVASTAEYLHATSTVASMAEYLHTTSNVAAVENRLLESKKLPFVTEAISNTEVPELKVSLFTGVSLSPISSQTSLFSALSETSTGIDCSATTSATEASYDSTKPSTTDDRSLHAYSNHVLGREMMEGAISSLQPSVGLAEDLKPEVHYVGFDSLPEAGECGAPNRKAHQQYRKWVEDEKRTMEDEISELRSANRVTQEKLEKQTQQTEELLETLNRREVEYKKRLAEHKATLKEETERSRKQQAIAVAQNQKFLSFSECLPFIQG